MNVPAFMLPRDLQLSNEYRFSRKHIDGYIRKELTDSEEIMALVDKGVGMLKAWLAGEYYESKNLRLQQLQQLDLKELVVDVLTGVAYFQKPELMTSATAQIASRLRFTDRREGILTAAEILAVLCDTDLFDIIKLGVNSSLMVQSRIELSEQLMEYIANSVFLPPMVCEPDTITNNRQSGYLTHNESVILRSYNHHDEDVCLDVVNLQNQIPLSLCEDFIRTFEEPEPEDLREVEHAERYNDFEIRQIIREKEQAWHHFKTQSLKIAAMLVGQGNRFWITNRVDKRGRLYASGYHINPQGSKYKKACIELADKEPVTGVPT